ncbi:FabD/lysophospholipase-like protein [Glonium stellatum]|uniref:FabD/lysophospholipase-like protein n=1 Tax=Glonium stellatum TaxID=574774 RepID=A0A8E2F7P3_9PEZI|nr:FabD/lysophospholipase-like protein [Glonium stellatum]
MPGRELNLLSLDRGGVRGLSSLYILQKLVETINPDDPPKPCDYFDMIGGTSTGGLLAIMLAYITLSVRIFKKKRHFHVCLTGQTHERFDSDELATAIKDVLVEQGLLEDSLLKEPNANCKVFVCCTSGGTSTTTLLRSYPPPRGPSAARATSAASSFFDPITIGSENRIFTDGGTGNTRCIVSIGTGVPSLKKFGKGIVDLGKSLLSIATETETTAELFHQEHSKLDNEGRYFRFNAPDGLADIGLEETSKKNTIADMTDHYLSTETVHKHVKMCAKALAERVCASNFA